MAEAVYSSEGDQIFYTPAAATPAGTVVRLPDGRAGYLVSAAAAGQKVSVQVSGIATVEKTDSMVMLKGSKLYFDVSASKAHLLQALGTPDFFLGTVVATASSSATTVSVMLNMEPKYTLALKDGCVCAPIPAITANPQGMAFPFGNGYAMKFDTAAEAEKFDALSINSVAVGTPGILNALICVNTNGDDAAFDLNVGLANGTHATDADSITESLFCHIDGASTNIAFESDDGTTEVAATDSTLDFTAGTPFLVQWDLTNDEDIQVYVNGVNVLPASVFKLNNATGPLSLLVHMEKTANDSPGNVTVMNLGLHTFDV
jgi:predicted RecA/RadA family phage recombinase